MDVDESSSDGEGDDDEEKSTKKKKKKKKVVKVVVKKSLKRFDLNSRSTQTRSYNYEVCEYDRRSVLILLMFMPMKRKIYLFEVFSAYASAYT